MTQEFVYVYVNKLTSLEDRRKTPNTFHGNLLALIPVMFRSPLLYLSSQALVLILKTNAKKPIYLFFYRHNRTYLSDAKYKIICVRSYYENLLTQRFGILQFMTCRFDCTGRKNRSVGERLAFDVVGKTDAGSGQGQNNDYYHVLENAFCHLYTRCLKTTMSIITTCYRVNILLNVPVRYNCNIIYQY